MNGRLEVNVNSIKLIEFHLADLNKFLISPYNYKLVNQNNAQIFFSQIIIWSSSFFGFKQIHNWFGRMVRLDRLEDFFFLDVYVKQEDLHVYVNLTDLHVYVNLHVEQADLSLLVFSLSGVIKNSRESLISTAYAIY